MKDSSNQPPKDQYGLSPEEIIKRKKKLKEILKDSHRKMMQNLAKGNRIDHDRIEEAVKAEIERRLGRGEKLINEQAIWKEVIAKKDALIDNLTQRALLMKEEESNQIKEEIIREKLESISGIVSLNQIEQEAQREINIKNQKVNEGIRSMVDFFEQEAQKIREESKDEEQDQ
ncbi:hypothetical protein CL656_03965 [bacterium]|nr:hypothetical protein [bacterium]|tara:strand:- start:2797 stop:3315 length:519 start_codon:yes stop_codon:yes gene_type:complete